MSETFNLSFEEFKTHARTGAVVPLIRTVFAGDETPVGLYEKLSKGKSGTFLLESAEQGVWSRFSFIGVNSRASLRQAAGQLEISNLEHVLPTGEQLAKDSLEAIDQIQTSWKSASIADLPPLSSGLVGFFAWDIIRALEKLKVAPPKTYNSQ